DRHKKSETYKQVSDCLSSEGSVNRSLSDLHCRDIEAFAATYHPEVEIAHFSKGLLYSGRETLIKRYGEKFDGLTYLRATSLKRIVYEQYLVDHELAESSDLASREINAALRWWQLTKWKTD
uniref:hypothetical protein n=1 Tax=Vibrio vulnificus TaxID=672 RepID=UPI001F4F0C05